MRLGDLGERRILAEILESRYAGRPGMGDDCAVIELSKGVKVVVTTDPCPPPMAEMVGFPGLYYHGWLLATINLSDLAAMGATPTGILTSLILPRDTTVDEFVSLLDGIDDCLRPFGANVLGGNIKEDPKMSLSATAIGICEFPPLTRAGAQVGDVAFIIGDLGRFWAAVLAYRVNLIQAGAQILEAVSRPRPKIPEGIACAQTGVVTSLIDSSDGLYPSLMDLARQSNVAFELDLDALRFDEDVAQLASQLGIDPVRFVLGWGDWVLVGTVPRDHFSTLRAAVEHSNGRINQIGHVVPSRIPRVTARYRGEEGPLMPLDSERFAPDSWFTAGLESYVSRLMGDPVIPP